MAAPAYPRNTGPALGGDTSDDDTAPPSISVATIEKPSLEGFGTIDQSSGGLPASIWKGSTREAAETLLEEVHAGVANETLMNLTGQLLMTQAAPPQGPSLQDWFILRVQTLITLGADDKAGQMLASVPVSMSTDAIRRLNAELLLLHGDTDNACKLSASITPDIHSTSGVFWEKLIIMCKARSGKYDEAMVAMDILREENQLTDPFFQEAIHKLGDKTATIKSIPKNPTIFDVALLHLTGDTDKLKERLDNVPPVVLKYLAQDATLDIKFREKALGKAQLMGVMPVKEGSKLPEQPFAKPLASDVSTLVRALGSGKAPNESDNVVIARLALDEGVAVQDSRRVQRLLTLMQPFGYKVTPAVWQKLFEHRLRFDGDVPPASLVSQLNDAAQTGRKGEVIMLAALIADGNDTDKLPDLALLPIVKGLIAAGFEKEARQVAYSAVKGYK